MMTPNLLASIVASQVQEHERGLGTWQTQWQVFPMMLFVCSGALGAIADVAPFLEDPRQLAPLTRENALSLLERAPS